MYELHVIVVHEIEHVKRAALMKDVAGTSFRAHGCSKKWGVQVKRKVRVRYCGDGLGEYFWRLNQSGLSPSILFSSESSKKECKKELKRTYPDSNGELVHGQCR